MRHQISNPTAMGRKTVAPRTIAAAGAPGSLPVYVIRPITTASATPAPVSHDMTAGVSARPTPKRGGGAGINNAEWLIALRQSAESPAAGESNARVRGRVERLCG